MIDRRTLLRGVALAALVPFVAGFPVRARAATPAAGRTEAEGIFHLPLGDVEVTALSDGTGVIAPGILHGAPAGDIDGLLRRAGFDPTVGSPVSINTFLVQTAGRLLLVDTGAGTYFGPRAGKLPGRLAAVGCDPARIDTVLLTHLHSDHAMGLTDVSGKPHFPGATVWVAAPEAAYWHAGSTLARATEQKKQYIKALDRALLPYAASGRLRTFTPGQTVVPGVTVEPLFGHTPGHCGFRLGIGEQGLLFWGDTVHVAAVQFPRPEVSIDFDVDQGQAVATRQALLSRLAWAPGLVAGAHLPFPGIGRVVADGTGSRWRPVADGAAGA